jgi:hypothetical protein
MSDFTLSTNFIEDAMRIYYRHCATFSLTCDETHFSPNRFNPPVKRVKFTPDDEETESDMELAMPFLSLSLTSPDPTPSSSIPSVLPVPGNPLVATGGGGGEIRGVFVSTIDPRPSVTVSPFVSSQMASSIFHTGKSSGSSSKKTKTLPHSGR